MPISLSDLLVVLATLVSAFGGAWLGHSLAHRSDIKRERVRDQSLIRSLLVEVDHNANLASTYVTENIIAPAYRLRREVFDTAFPVLLRGRLKADDVVALLSFYSQVDQVNFGLDEVDRLRRSDAQHVPRERLRLIAKANEMVAPESRFYSPVAAVLMRYVLESER